MITPPEGFRSVARRRLLMGVDEHDANGSMSFFGYVKPSGGSGIDGRLPGTTCKGSGVYDRSSGSLNAITVAGPCDTQSGKKVF
jgi:hypothetical protein